MYSNMEAISHGQLIAITNKIFEFSNPLIGIFIYFPIMKFQNTFIVNFQKSYLISKPALKINYLF